MQKLPKPLEDLLMSTQVLEFRSLHWPRKHVRGLEGEIPRLVGEVRA